GMQDFEVKGRMGMRRRSSVNDFVSRELLLQEAARRGLETTGEGRAVNEAALRALEARQKKTMAEIYRAMGENGALFKKRLDEDALIQTLRLAEHGDRMRVGDADIGAYYERHKAYIERCAATNRFIMARGGTFVAWVRGGEDFAELADRFSEFGDGPGGEWGTFFPVEIDDPQVRKAAVETPVGGVAGPFDTEDGMVVIKVLAREGAGAESLVNQNPLTVKLARIGLRMFENHSPDDPLPSREDVRKALEIQRLEEVQREWLPNLRAAACIEYPNGTNFWGKAAK
ncbi:MAG: peptidyl-prolyl cis-trans isomerase, partial [Kiritimatiellaeota bacterium]|nr:peptidyl-prolyl cis-trans isomerase [Kiritimatiellota bacterium]